MKIIVRSLDYNYIDTGVIGGVFGGSTFERKLYSIEVNFEVRFLEKATLEATVDIPIGELEGITVSDYIRRYFS